MKKIYLFIMLAFALVLSGVFAMGCNQDVFQTADTLYLDIKTIVTDEEVMPLIPDKTMEHLAVVEKVYLSATKLKDVDPNDIKPFELLIACADEILSLMDDLQLGEKYDKPLAAIRISVKMLRNHIKLE